jgi:hypothetical protein
VAAAQLAVESPLSKVDLSGAAGFYSFNDNEATTDIALADMDYAIGVAGVRAAEFRLACAFGPSWNVMLRVYAVEGIELESPTAIALEDGKRARLDFNIAF